MKKKKKSNQKYYLWAMPATQTLTQKVILPLT